jgi:hypothetical protein
MRSSDVNGNIGEMPRQRDVNGSVAALQDYEFLENRSKKKPATEVTGLF